MRTIIAIMMASVLWANSAYSQLLPPDDPNYERVFFEDFDTLGVRTQEWQRICSWQNVEYGINKTGDTIWLMNHKTDDNRNYIFDTVGDGSISLRANRETGYTGLTIDYNKLVYLDTTTVFDTVHVGSHDDTLIVASDTTYVGNQLYVIFDSLLYLNDTLFERIDSIKVDFTKKMKPFDYTSGMLISKDMFRYGYFEIRTHMPYLPPGKTNRGVGPNFWLWNKNDTCEWSEIDIYEIKDHLHDPNWIPTGYTPHRLTSATHFQSTPSALEEMNCNEEGSLIFGISDYAVLSAWWTPDSITFYKNDSCFWQTIDHASEMIAMPMFIDNGIPLYYNVEDPYEWMPDSTTVMPYYYNIDYVAVYQIDTMCTTDLTVAPFVPASFDYGLYRNLTFGGSGTSSTISSGTVVPIKATESVTINGEFTVESGAELSIDFMDCPDQSRTKSTEVPSVFPPSSFLKAIFNMQ
jgi:hypothetical protein